MKLTENSLNVWTFVKNNGGKVAISEVAEALGKNTRSVGANVTDLTKKGLAQRVKETVGDEEITYVALTADGMAFVQGAE